jgi:hypothetical protein
MRHGPLQRKLANAGSLHVRNAFLDSFARRVQKPFDRKYRLRKLRVEGRYSLRICTPSAPVRRAMNRYVQLWMQYSKSPIYAVFSKKCDVLMITLRCRFVDRSVNHYMTTCTNRFAGDTKNHIMDASAFGSVLAAAKWPTVAAE